MVSNAKVNASGAAGGGDIVIGGDAHGAGPDQNADYTLIGSNVTINANALVKGNGGDVVVWSTRILNLMEVFPRKAVHWAVMAVGLKCLVNLI